MMEVIKHILIARQTPDLVFEYEELQSILVSNLNPGEHLNIQTVLFDLENYIMEKEKKKISEDTDFKKLPLGKTPIIIDEVKYRLIEDIKNKRKRGGMSVVAEEKLVQEITFVDNFFHTERGRDIASRNPDTTHVKKKKKKKNDDYYEEEEIELDKNMQKEEMNKQNMEEKHLSQEEKDERQMKMVIIVTYFNNRCRQ